MPTESLFPRIDIPNIDIWTFLFERQPPYPDDKIIYRDAETNRTYSYAQTRKTAVDFGTGLKSEWNWKKGDVLGVFSPNCIDIPAVIWGVLWAGGIVSPANPGYTVDELTYQLHDAGAKALITQTPFLGVAVEAARRAGIPEDRIIVVGEPSRKHFTTIRNLSGTSRFRRTKTSPDDVAFIAYSSGTTGRPKGVMLSHGNLVANILQAHAVEGKKLGLDDRILGFLPFFHIYGLSCLIHQAMYIGYELVVMSKFDIERFCDTIQRYRVTFAYVVPPVVLLLGKHPAVSKYDLSSIRMMNSGAAPLTRELVDAVHKRIRAPIKQGYGLTETSPTTHTQRWDDWDRYVGSVGRMLPNQTAKYMADDREVPVGETGELWIKGPNVFKGYHKNAEATANALTPDGYFRTGDVGHQDEEGNFYITDRVKELIKYKGFQVPPAELEGLLASHPVVNDVAVIGVYDKSQATEVPRACVVARPGVEKNAQTEAEIVQWLQGRVASHKRLRGGIRWVDEIPKSASGKILRRMLKAKESKL